MNCYLDSSVILRNLLGSPRRYDDFKKYERIGSSEIVHIECHRVLDRYRMEKVLTDDQVAELKYGLNGILAGMHIIELTDAVKMRAAESFPTIIGTLDAIHLATAMLWKRLTGPDITIVTHDRQMASCARALGFTVNGVD